MSGPPNLFGGFGKPAETQNNAAANANSSAPAPSFAGFNLGGATNPPSNPNPLFGGSSPGTFGGGGGLFGSKPGGAEAPKAPAFGLTAPATGAPPNLFGSTPAAPGASTLPAPTPAPGGLFTGFGKPATPQPGGLFGAKPAEPAPQSEPAPQNLPPGGTNPLFGGSAPPAPAADKPAGGSFLAGFGPSKPAEASKPPPLFGSSTPAVPSSTIPAPPSNPAFNLFSKPADQSSPAVSTPAPKPPLFGAPPPIGNAPSGDPQKPPTGNTPAAKPPLFDGNFFKTPPSTSEAQTAGASTTSAPKPSLFAGFAPTQSGTADKDKKDGTTPAPAAPSSFSSFMKKPGETSSSKEGPSTTAPAPSLFGGATLGKKPDDPKAGSFTPSTAPIAGKDGAPAPTAAPPAPSANTPAATAPAPQPSATAPSSLRGKSIDEIVNKWDKELQSSTQEFTRIASEVAAWDKVLIENGNYIAQLHNQVLNAEATQQLVEQTLASVEAQQAELGSILEVYEKQAKEILDGSGGGLRALDTGPADAERDRSYTLATELTVSLDELTKSLTQMISSVNDLSISSGNEASAADKSDPLTQIAEVLNEHLVSLNWIDGAINDMEAKMKMTAPKLAGTAASVNGEQNSGRRSYHMR